MHEIDILDIFYCFNHVPSGLPLSHLSVLNLYLLQKCWGNFSIPGEFTSVRPVMLYDASGKDPFGKRKQKPVCIPSPTFTSHARIINATIRLTGFTERSREPMMTLVCFKVASKNQSRNASLTYLFSKTESFLRLLFCLAKYLQQQFREKNIDRLGSGCVLCNYQIGLFGDINAQWFLWVVGSRNGQGRSMCHVS